MTAQSPDSFYIGTKIKNSLSDSDNFDSLRTVQWKDNKVIMIDQTKLPNKLEFVEYTTFQEIAHAIKTLIVRGAPAIGVSAAFGLALAALQSTAQTRDALLADLEAASTTLAATRPTAVNLVWGLKTNHGHCKGRSYCQGYNPKSYCKISPDGRRRPCNQQGHGKTWLHLV